MLTRLILKWVLIFACWTLLGLFSASQTYLRYAYYSDTPPTWQFALTVALSDWYAWASLSPLLFWFARRFPLQRENRWRRYRFIFSPVCCFRF